MNKKAEKHLSKAQELIAKGDEFYRRAKPEIEAAVKAGATHREVARFLAKSHRWVQDVIAWDGEGTLYAKDTERRQTDMAKQVLREAPLEQIEQIVADLPFERQEAVAAAAGNRYAKRRQEYDERERRMTPVERKEREAVASGIDSLAKRAMQGFDGLAIVTDLEHAAELLKDMIAHDTVSPDLIRGIDTALAAFLDEYRVAQAMVGEEASA